jgi:nicotinate-nucleotide adenylyltransferase
MRLGIFGGTFDPPHLGHQILAMECAWQLKLDRVLWVLTPYPPHKTGQQITSLENRLELVRAAIQGEPCFELSTVDIDRPGPYYALDTVKLLRQKDPAATWIYLMGGDSLNDLPEWHNPGEFIRACDEIGVMRRPGENHRLETLEDLLPGLQARLRFVETPMLEISSSEIRRRLKVGLPVRYYLVPQVYALIHDRNWYRG